MLINIKQNKILESKFDPSHIKKFRQYILFLKFKYLLIILLIIFEVVIYWVIELVLPLYLHL